MRADILPLCDKDHSVMFPAIAPLTRDSGLEYYHCRHGDWCPRCYSAALGYATTVKGERPRDVVNEPRCRSHAHPMFISSVDRQHGLLRYACPEQECCYSLTLPLR
jgi:hypothetical protein